MKIQTSVVLEQILAAQDKRGIVLEGGSRSSKTWSIIQFLVLYCQAYKNEGKEITICRDRLTWLKLTVLRDFQTILKLVGWWNDADFNKSEMTYKLFGNRFTFIGLDEPAKLGGLKQNVFWLNEVIGTAGSAFNATKDVFDNLEQRTTELWLCDYNPKVTKHWLFDNILSRPDVAYIHSTMVDNPFLEEPIRQKILSYEPTADNITNGTADAVKWKVYGLGQRGQHQGVIFTNVDFVKFFPADCKRVWYGLDFGFINDVTALVKVGMQNGQLYVEQLIYETGLTNNDISQTMIEAGLHNQCEIVADSAEQKSIVELQRLGWKIEPAMKGADSVLFGINALKNYKINIVETSLDTKTEFENYVWKENQMTGEVSNTPVDKFNHCFTGETLITTSKGLVRIDAMKVGDLVLTRKGFRKVQCVFNNGLKQVNNYLMQLDMFSISLCATSSHKIKTSNQWKQISKLKQGQVLTLHRPSMEKLTHFIQVQDTFQEGTKECTLLCGNTTMEKHQKDSKFITSMKTPLTITLKTLKSKQSISTFQNTARKDTKTILTGQKDFNKKELQLHHFGTGQQKVLIGTGRMQEKTTLESLTFQKETATGATNNTNQKQSIQNSVIRTAKLSHYVQEESKTALVYDLMIEGEHEYFANGVLVHNCIDAIRYVALNKFAIQPRKTKRIKINF